MKIKELLKDLTLKEKVSLTSGRAFWHTQSIEGKVPSIMMTDGPHGLRKQKNREDTVGMNDSVPATCFPSSATICNSWDEELMEKVGEALGEECQAYDVHVLLGPGVNIKRSPLCGRNFEYFSEDPYLSAHMAAAHVRGVQSQGVGACVKHFAVNNQETNRFTINAVVDERTLREIYLNSFETVIKEAKPWMVMGAYNRVNGTYCCEHRQLLKQILREEWGYEGVVVSDWGAASDAVKGIENSFDLRMPGPAKRADGEIAAAVREGRLSEKTLDETVNRILTLVEKGIENHKSNVKLDIEGHHMLAREAAAESAVLLKNDKNILPLRKSRKIAVIGGFAKNIRYQGGGSSHVNAAKTVNLIEAYQKLQPEVKIKFARGFRIKKDEIDDAYIQEAVSCAKDSDCILLNLGLPYRKESEGYDRKDMALPDNQTELLNRLSECGKPIVVVLYMGAPIEMPWLNEVDAVLAMYTGGQAVAEATVQLLYGDKVPCGKLAESYPYRMEHNPSSLNFPQKTTACYEEGIYVGYRYYDKKRIEVQFPFGYGLSYTKFEYNNILISRNKITDQEDVNVTADITNTGNVAAKEIVQFYVRDVESSVSKPEKELKGFAKVFCMPGETKRVTFKLDKRSFAYYDTDLHDWYVESGAFEILIGASSRDIRLREVMIVESTVEKKIKYTLETPLSDIFSNPAAAQFLLPMLNFGALGEESRIFPEEKRSIMDDEEDNRELAIDEERIGRDMPIGKIVDFSGGAFTEDRLKGILEILNRG